MNSSKKKRKNSMHYFAANAAGLVWGVPLELAKEFVARPPHGGRVPGVSLFRFYAYLKCVSANTHEFSLKHIGRDFIIHDYGCSSATIYRYMRALVDMGLARKTGVSTWHLPTPMRTISEGRKKIRVKYKNKITVSKEFIKSKNAFEGFIYSYIIYKDVVELSQKNQYYIDKTISDLSDEQLDYLRDKIIGHKCGGRKETEDELKKTISGLRENPWTEQFIPFLGLGHDQRSSPGDAEGAFAVSHRFTRKRVKAGLTRINRGFKELSVIGAVKRYKNSGEVHMLSGVTSIDAFRKVTGTYAFFSRKTGKIYAIEASRMFFKYISDGFVAYQMPMMYREFLKRKWIRNRGYEGKFNYWQLSIDGRYVSVRGGRYDYQLDWFKIFDYIANDIGTYRHAVDEGEYIHDLQPTTGKKSPKIGFDDLALNGTWLKYVLELGGHHCSCTRPIGSIDYCRPQKFFDFLINYDIIKTVSALKKSEDRGHVSLNSAAPPFWWKAVCEFRHTPERLKS